MNELVISGANLSETWARAFLRVARAHVREARPLVVTVSTALGRVLEREDIRHRLDCALGDCGEYSVGTVASTIFPKSLWAPSRPRKELFERYEAVWPRVEKVSANRYGTYFRRFTSFGASGVNQIEHILTTWKKGNHRRSALQLAVFDPERDHVHNRRRGFPCLHQVAIVPGANGGMSLTGFYATQLVFEKAYGNYLGLANLGAFLATELGMQLTGITCVASVAILGQNPTFDRLRPQLVDELAALVHEGTGGGSP